MDFNEELAAFRAAHPDVTLAEVFMIDLNATVRGKLVPIEALEKLADGGMKLPTSTPGLDLFGEDVYEAGLAVQTGDPDGVLDPVPGSLGRMTWVEKPTAHVQVTIRAPDGSAPGFDPRNVLARVAANAEARGLIPVIALEQEFFLIDLAQPLPPLNPLTGERLQMGQVYELDIGRAFAPILDDISRGAEVLGVPAEAVVTEFGYGQFEINLAHVDNALVAADHAVALRRVIRGVARAHGLDATFMSKPYGDTVGSGLHAHLSLRDREGHNLFDGPGSEPNAEMGHALAGCLAHMAECMLIFAPHLNSYRRFLPNSLAPTEAHWAHDHRGAAMRVPEVSGKAARIEHRLAGADANPYLVIAAILAAVLQGVESRLPLPPAVEGELSPGMGGPLPLEWSSAERAFSASDFVKTWLGEEVQHVFGALKRQERGRLLAMVTDVEKDLYLRRG